MECYICGTIVDRESSCPHCGANITAYRKIINQSNIFYNEALKKAQVRDLSGAQKDLKQSLKSYKYNIDARNLLGLIYYEVGDLVEALAEWIISVNLQPENNKASRYLEEFSANNGVLETMNNTIKKYNQAIEYCREGNRDLARIQLRRVIGMNPNMVKAHQLLALISIVDGKYDEARKSLSAANKIDARNTTTLRYMKEVKAGLKAMNASSKKKRKDVNTYIDGNDTVMIPEHGFFDWFDSSKSSLLNMLMGLGIGLLICFVLIVPTVKQNAKIDAANDLVDANEEAAGASSSVSSLKKQVNDLTKQLDKYNGKGSAVTSYENLILAKEAYDSGDISKTAEYFANIEESYLDSKGKAIYDTMSQSVYSYQVESGYKSGLEAFNQEKYEEAIKYFLAVIELDSSYESGEALWYLGQCYAQDSDTDNAVKYYKQLLKEQPNTSHKDDVKNYLNFSGASQD